MSKAAIYIRVSTGKQAAEGYSLGQQRTDCEAFIEHKGWTLTKVYEDAGISGAKKSRPALDALLSSIKAGELDALVSPHIDRVGRSAANTHELFSIFDAAGIALWKPTGERYDGSSSEAKLMRSVIAAAAQYERDRLSERNALAAIGKRERGTYNGGPIPFGYELANSGLVPCEPEAKWIRHMFRRYAREDASFYEIAKELAAAEVPTRRAGIWSGNAVATRIKNPIYIGKVSEDSQGTHEPLIDEDTWTKAKRRRTSIRLEDGYGRGKRSNTHLVDHGMLKCWCGASMQPKTYPSGTQVYICRSAQHGAKGCGQGPITREAVDSALLKYLATQVLSPALTATELEAERKRAESDAKSAKSEAKRTQREAINRREAAELRWLDEKLSDERWNELQEKFAAIEKQAESDAARAEATLTALASQDEDSRQTVEQLRRDLAEAVKSPQNFRGILGRLYERIELVAADGTEPPSARTEQERAGMEAQQAAEAPDEALIGFEDKGQLYGLVPVLHADLALLYGADPLVGAGDSIASIGSPIRAIGFMALSLRTRT